MSIVELLSPSSNKQRNNSDCELRERLHTSDRIDSAVIGLLHEQLNLLRRLDRRLGSAVAYEEVQGKMAQVKRLFSYSQSPGTRACLAALLSELSMLAGWQALDRRNVKDAWKFYEYSKAAANESGSHAFQIHANSQQAFVLIDIGKSARAADLLLHARDRAVTHSPTILRSWLAAAHGEALAAIGDGSNCLRAFDDAMSMALNDTVSVDGPHVSLDKVHLGRWRGHALARLGMPEAVSVLREALEEMDPSFARAETALRVDLATALASVNECEEAQHHARYAEQLAAVLGSVRQQQRIGVLDKCW